MRLAYLRKLVRRKGPDGHAQRWFADLDAAAAAVRHRHGRQFLADLVVITQRGHPYNQDIRFEDNMNDVFNKTQQSLLAASHVSRDHYLFQVPASDTIRGLARVARERACKVPGAFGGRE